MLSPKGSRSPLLALSVTAGFILIFAFGFLAWQTPPRIPFPHGSTHIEMTVSNQNTPPISMEEVIRLLYARVKIPVDQQIFTDYDGTEHELPANPRYKKKLGKDVLIVDLETRPLESEKEWREGHFDWTKLNHVSGGVFQHYIYALIHGYDYKFITAHEFEDRHATWIKPSAIANQLHDYKFVVFLDADAAFHHMQLPVEWLLNYWKIEPKHSITMAKDPWDPEHPEVNSDRFNRALTNTGFMIVQNNPTSHQILKAWHECPDDVRYIGCSEWKRPRFHEQSAFGEFIRYDYEENIKELECAEANGYPGVEVSHCQGKFIRHYWFDKYKVKNEFQENIMQAITQPIQQTFADNYHGVTFEQKENKIL
ncbi:uncharacterized protein BDR25DRAFT_220233 [Lindgomyces ingoldianus]|uniref:Uncharacterized protein n=1 Tax=Lindgomyces ingoldianus TaxID=673940 RepID=A0ACB6R083_9PLEO|nr:uncharacterized protein BDR25DRAFT_220233 [Lindgomyces ingoldianus]KAF2472591.1 hypothetical protein BDR25DRAFT_220233 [Lindgomyces ingoldianus]